MSKIEVDAITEQSGTTLTTGGGAGKTVVVDATTVTLGRCGGTVALASGASQTGFGRTGTVDWQTGSIKTATFTAANGEGYFCNTSGGAFTVNLPAGSAGAIVAISDYTRTFNSNNLTIAPNGSEKIGGIAQDLILDINGQALTLVYVDGTEGWINVQNAEDTETGIPQFITASGGTITECGDFKIHTFTGPGTFSVSNIAPGPSGNPNAGDYLVIGGGGGSGKNGGGGGGAGGFRTSAGTATGCYTVSPLGSGVSALTITAQTYPITVGGGGAGVNGCVPFNPGSNSVFSTITSTGGGAAGAGDGPTQSGASGGSGGGAHRLGSDGSGNTPPTSPSQGNPGNNGNGNGGSHGGGGGGGGAAGSAGGCGVGGNGGDGSYSNINPAKGVADGPVGPGRYYSGGGGGGGASGSDPSGGAGGGANGTAGASGSPKAASGTTNTGGGAGGGAQSCSGGGGNGGDGIVIIRYKFQ